MTTGLKILSVGLMIGSPENGFQKAMRKVATGGYMDMPCSSSTNFNSELMRAAVDFQPDIIFIQIQHENILSEETARQLAKLAFVINFSGDVREELPSWYLDIGKHIQLSTFSNMVDVKKCISAGIPADYLEIGFDPEIYRPRDIQKSGPAIVAHFNHYENKFPLSAYRMEIVQALTKEFGDNFGVYGNFPGARGNFNSDQIAESINYNKAKIAINCSHFDYERYSSDRLLRILGSGTFCLSHHYNAIEKDFDLRDHLTTFYDINELINRCKMFLYYMPKKREIIARAGSRLAHQNFTFDSMCENIVKLYKKHKKYGK